MKYYATEGRLGKLPGIYMVGAASLRSAKKVLQKKGKLRGRYMDLGGLQEDWEGLRWMVEDIEMGNKERYTDLGNGVYFFEI